MPRSWQIIHARALQTLGIWELDPAFLVRDKGRADLQALAESLVAAAQAVAVAENTVDTHLAGLAAEYAFLKTMNVAIAARMRSEVAAEDPLHHEIELLTRIAPQSRAEVEARALKTLALWEKLDAARAAALPPQPAIVVRQITRAGYQARWAGLAPLRQAREAAAGVWHEKKNTLATLSRAADRLNKAWYLAWRSEYPADTPQGAALAGVDTETSTPPPLPLEIAAVTAEELFLRVTYVPGSGRHATARELCWQADGAEEQRTPAEPGGNTIGPFTPGQTVRVWADVGNSRARSVRGAAVTAEIP